MTAKRSIGWALAAAGICGALALGSCTDGLLLRPAADPPVTLALGLAPSAALAGTDADACAKANSARVRLFQADVVTLDTTLTVSRPCDQAITLKLPLRLQLGSLQLVVALLANSQPVFQGSASVQLARGQKTQAQVPVAPVPAGILAPDSLRTFTKLGDSLRLGGAVTFATGDTVQGAQPTWTDDGKGIVSLANGFVRSRAEGSAQLTASYQGVTKTTRVSVRAVVASVAVTGVGDTARMFIGSARTFAAVARDSSSNVLQRTINWASGNTRVATVDAGGAVHALVSGSAVISAASEAKADSFTLTVGPVPVVRVAVTPGSASLTARNPTVQLTATTFGPADTVLTDRSVVWSTSNGQVAGVSTTGLVTAFSGGRATITATSEAVSGSASISVEQLLANPGFVIDTVQYGSATPSVATVRITNAGAAALGGLSISVTYPLRPSGSPTPPFITSNTLSSSTTPSTLTLQMTATGLFCDEVAHATVTITSTTPGVAPADVPITHTAFNPTGC